MSASFPWPALALIAAAAVAPDGAALAQRAAGDPTGQRARQAFGADTSMPARESARVPSEERLLEQIERTRKAFQADLAEDVRGDTGPSEERLIEQLRGVREEIESGPADAEEGAMPSEAEVADLRERLGEQFGVDVLEVRGIEADGRPAWAVKVMNPGGNFNAAFMVTTLVVDQESGEVLGELRSSIATGTDFPERGARREPATDESGLAIRRRTYR